MFSKITSKNERIYVIFVVALSIGLFSISRTVWWLYGMVFLLFLSAFIFRDRPTKKGSNDKSCWLCSIMFHFLDRRIHHKFVKY